MSDAWPDDWPLAAISEIEHRDDEIERLRGIIEEQRLTIGALNMAIGGEGSTTTENLRRADQPADAPCQHTGVITRAIASDRFYCHTCDTVVRATDPTAEPLNPSANLSESSHSRGGRPGRLRP